MAHFHLVAPIDVYSDTEKKNALRMDHHTTLDQLGDPMLSAIAQDATSVQGKTQDGLRMHHFAKTDLQPERRVVAGFIKGTYAQVILPPLFEELVLGPIVERHDRSSRYVSQAPSLGVRTSTIQRHLLRLGQAHVTWVQCERLLADIAGALDAFDIVHRMRHALIETANLGFQGQNFRLLKFSVAADFVFIEYEHTDGKLPGDYTRTSR